uniref:Uncharacterized protein n=2 Tax=Torrey Pines virus TaxID=1654361 RepID=A0A2Z4QKV3_9REOV|nr:hypothetical protein [Torrey Pines virus]AWY11150.1 hypothetical protein [Torrey Pines virus]
MSVTSPIRLNSIELFTNLLTTELRAIDIQNRDLQTHVIWTLAGLLLVQPKQDDFLYYSTDSREKDATSTQKTWEIRDIGSYHFYTRLPHPKVREIMVSVYKTFHDDLRRFEEMGRVRTSYINANTAIKDISKRLTREIQFILVGFIVCDLELSMEMFRYMHEPITGYSLMRPHSSTPEDRDWLRASLSARTILSTSSIKLRNGEMIRNVVRSASFYGHFTLIVCTSRMASNNQQGSASSQLRVGKSEALASVGEIRLITYDQTIKLDQSQKVEIQTHVNDAPAVVRAQMEAVGDLLIRTSAVKNSANMPDNTAHQNAATTPRGAINGGTDYESWG